MNSDTSLNRNHEGIGLGLHIAKSYTEYLGGKIWLEELEDNNVFCFTVKIKNSVFLA